MTKDKKLLEVYLHVIRNRLIYSVIYQDPKTRPDFGGGTLIFRSEKAVGFSIASALKPDISSDRIYIGGADASQDDRILTRAYASEKQAHFVKRAFETAVAEFNEVGGFSGRDDNHTDYKTDTQII